MQMSWNYSPLIGALLIQKLRYLWQTPKEISDKIGGIWIEDPIPVDDQRGVNAAATALQNPAQMRRQRPIRHRPRIPRVVYKLSLKFVFQLSRSQTAHSQLETAESFIFIEILPYLLGAKS